MLHWALVLFVLALVAAFFGFGTLAGAAASVAELFFYGFLALAIIILIANFTRRSV
ncbi:MAG TPA: DUF1328 domain-containing protein [Polyangiaceae bacterium]|jgi:uncharacterized membrane protein YtjA (UPF0391 family)|nr:DUF1328 domain-containing protein [Polyangiaceae bacterium]